MFRMLHVLGLLHISFPRVRGDVPLLLPLASSPRPFSPRARGCSGKAMPTIDTTQRFPRVRGDVPIFIVISVIEWGFSPRARGCSVFTHALDGFCQRFPRVRGDVPNATRLSGLWFAFSPRARGCSPVTPTQTFDTKVFPACAGMFRYSAGAGSAPTCFPRVRGDVPPWLRAGE